MREVPEKRPSARAVAKPKAVAKTPRAEGEQGEDSSSEEEEEEEEEEETEAEEDEPADEYAGAKKLTRAARGHIKRIEKEKAQAGATLAKLGRQHPEVWPVVEYLTCPGARAEESPIFAPPAAVFQGPSSSSTSAAVAQQQGKGPQQGKGGRRAPPRAVVPDWSVFEQHIRREAGSLVENVHDSSGEHVGHLQAVNAGDTYLCSAFCHDPRHRDRSGTKKCSRLRGWEIATGEPIDKVDWVLTKWLLDHGKDSTGDAHMQQPRY
jgi:hypothetical protein